MKITVKASREYDVIIGKGIIAKSGELIAGIHSPCRAMLVGDDNTGRLYFSAVERSMKNAGFSCEHFIFGHGEKSKNVRTLTSLWETLAKAHFGRGDIIVAVGGGVTGDISGFAAATYLRGIEYIQIPTSLLAMTDSSVGGKTAVDLTAGKNLAGVFYQPSLVICDPEVLNTLPARYFNDGMAEVIKYGMINRPMLLEDVRKLPKGTVTEEIIASCIDDKRFMVEADERDNGKRKLLNFGHTVGHAVELCSHYTVTHGKAVSVGMAIVTRSASRHGICDEALPLYLSETLRRYRLPAECKFETDDLMEAILTDKKRDGDKITLIIPYAAGDCRMKDMLIGEVAEFVGKGRA